MWRRVRGGPGNKIWSQIKYNPPPPPRDGSRGTSAANPCNRVTSGTQQTLSCSSGVFVKNPLVCQSFIPVPMAYGNEPDPNGPSSTDLNGVLHCVSINAYNSNNNDNRVQHVFNHKILLTCRPAVLTAALSVFDVCKQCIRSSCLSLQSTALFPTRKQQLHGYPEAVDMAPFLFNVFISDCFR